MWPIHSEYLSLFQLCFRDGESAVIKSLLNSRLAVKWNNLTITPVNQENISPRKMASSKLHGNCNDDYTSLWNTQADSCALFSIKKNFFFCRQEALWCVSCKRPAHWDLPDLKNYSSIFCWLNSVDLNGIKWADNLLLHPVFLIPRNMWTPQRCALKLCCISLVYE